MEAPRGVHLPRVTMDRRRDGRPGGGRVAPAQGWSWRLARRGRPRRGALVKCLVAAIVLVASLAAARSLAAQESEDGPRVRVTLRRPADVQRGELWQRQLIGTMTSVSPDSMTLSLDPPVGTLTLASADMRRIEVSRGVPGRFASALQRGLGGALGGAILGSLYNLIFEGDDSVSVGESAGEWAGVFGGWGLVTGAIAPQEGWRRTRWDDLYGDPAAP